MQSIIICSRCKNISAELRSNIRDTFGGNEGVDYELVIIDNSNNDYSICAAYNEGVRRAKGDILDFIHEDVLFHTCNWGRLVAINLIDEKIGMIAVAGTHFLPRTASSWWAPNLYSQNLLQGYMKSGVYQTLEIRVNNCEDGTDRLVSADGLFLCIPRRMFDVIRWDEDLLKGFHGYDTDISLQVLKSGREIHLNWDIKIEHKSFGNGTSKSFFEAQDIVFEKWHSFLPQTRGVEISSREMSARELLSQQYRKTGDIKNSLDYRLGSLLLHPSLCFESLCRHLKAFVKLAYKSMRTYLN